MRASLALVMLLLGSVASAQTFTSDFSSSANWSASTTALGNGQVSIATGNANYVVASPTDNDLGYITFTGAVGSYNSNWTVTVDIFYSTPSSIFTTTAEQAINLGLGVMKTGGSYGLTQTGAPSNYSYGASLNLYQGAGSTYSRDFRAGYTDPSGVPDSTQFVDGSRFSVGSVSGSTAGSIQISFDAATRTLTSSYDANGPTGGYSYTSQGLPLDVSSWNMVTGDTFTVMLSGNSIFDAETGSGVGPTIASGLARFDTFSANGLTAIPEPSTYAALAGCCVLGLAVWRRIRRGA